MIDWHSLSLAVGQYLPQYFFGTLAAAAFGAFAGAWINTRIQAKKTLVAELNAVSAAIVLSAAISNKFMMLKKHAIRDIHARHVEARKAFLKSRFSVFGNPKPEPFKLETDFQSITPIVVPIQILERHLFERISIRGRALAAAVDLASAIDSLNQSIKYRNELIEEIRKTVPFPEAKALAERYFGVANKDGQTDNRFRAGIEAIYGQTDDCIFFSRILVNDLSRYGSKLRRRNRWKYVSGIPNVSRADWSRALRDDLMPKDEEYALWLQGFRTDKSIWAQLSDSVRVWMGRDPTAS